MGIYQSLSSLYWLVSTLSILLISACLLTIFNFPSEFNDIVLMIGFAVLALAITHVLCVPHNICKHSRHSQPFN
ncbi:hypothetical protein C8J57DRAFT_1384507 [Mycena rebaudengoi]|nr:hypothetical protein C8J57DRAFT_1384507 [Mycena rebaudengoi]